VKRLKGSLVPAGNAAQHVLMETPNPRPQRTSLRKPLTRKPLGLVPWTDMEFMVRDEEHAVRDQSRG
jgi:hypothetical protein